MDVDPTRPPRRKLRLPGGQSTHGLGPVGTLVRAASRARLDGFDRRTAAGRLLREAREDFTTHLGGEDEVSIVERELIEQTAMRKLLVALVKEIFLRVQSGGGTPRDIVETARELAALSDGYTRLLKEIGRRPRAKEVSLVEEIAALHREQEAARRAAVPTAEVVAMQDAGDEERKA